MTTKRTAATQKVVPKMSATLGRWLGCFESLVESAEAAGAPNGTVADDATADSARV